MTELAEKTRDEIKQAVSAMETSLLFAELDDTIQFDLLGISTDKWGLEMQSKKKVYLAIIDELKTRLKEKGGYVGMNGYSMLADSYRTLAENGKIGQEEAEKHCKTLDFLAICDKDDICNLFNSSAFNDIAKAYCEVALKNLGYEQEQIYKAMNEIGLLFSESTAKEILRKAGYEE